VIDGNDQNLIVASELCTGAHALSLALPPENRDQQRSEQGPLRRERRSVSGGTTSDNSLATFLSGSVDPAVTMKVLRHKRLATTMEIYTHRVNNQQQAAQGLFFGGDWTRSTRY
jgi:hypothetical protein